MQRRPAVEALLAAERQAEQAAEAKVGRARQEASNLEQRVRDIRALLNPEREGESHRAFRSQLDEIDREIQQAQARRRQVELQVQQHKAGMENLRSELAQITGEDLSLSAAA
jgi:predicted  nucleic acid-binding Zn-ribbon protein